MDRKAVDELRCGKAHDGSAVTVFEAIIFPLEHDGVGIVG